jgi:hypothetical protein
MLRPSAALAFAAVLACASPALYAQDVRESVHLVVTGGPNAGTFDNASDRGGCSVGLTGPGSFGNQLSNPRDKDPKHFNSLQLVVPDATAAATGTSEFFLSVGFGPLLARAAEYKVETRSGEAKKAGSGTVTIADHGATATVKFSAITADGVKLEGTIECRSVMRAGAPKPASS